MISETCPECGRRPLLVVAGDVEGSADGIEYCVSEGTVYLHKVPQPSFSREDGVDAVQRAATLLGEPLSMESYEEWATGSVTEPSVTRLAYGASSLFDSWPDACGAAGVEPPGVKWTEESVRAVLRSVGRDLGELSSPAYTKLSKGEVEYPSTRTVRNYLGSWDIARDLMQAGERAKEIDEVRAELEAAGIPPRRSEIVAHVIVRPERYSEIADDLEIAKETVGSQVARYREARETDADIRGQTPPVGRGRGRRPDDPA
jgi:hypothetical protein